MCEPTAIAAYFPSWHNAIHPAGSSERSGIRTDADARLQADVTQSVINYEVAAGGVANVVLVAAKSLGKEGQTFIEQWTYESASKTVEYKVQFTVSARGGVDFVVAKLR